jgi:hypothetical protein
MSLLEELKNTDIARATNIFADTFSGTAITRPEFLTVEFLNSGQPPIFRGIQEGFETKFIPLLADHDVSSRRIRDIQTGLEMSRIAISIYATSEIPDYS